MNFDIHNKRAKFPFCFTCINIQHVLAFLLRMKWCESNLRSRIFIKYLNLDTILSDPCTNTSLCVCALCVHHHSAGRTWKFQKMLVSFGEFLERKKENQKWKRTHSSSQNFSFLSWRYVPVLKNGRVLKLHGSSRITEYKKLVDREYGNVRCILYVWTYYVAIFTIATSTIIVTRSSPGTFLVDFIIIYANRFIWWCTRVSVILTARG